jgi:RNA polymerase sigma factor (sigma-70 family)
MTTRLPGGKSTTIRPTMQKIFRRESMKEQTKTEITIETHRTFIVRRRPHLTWSWCGDCAATTRFASPEDAAQLVSGSAREIYRRIEAGQIHFIETGDHLLRVCLDSLSPAGNAARQTLPLEPATPLPVETEMSSETVVETVSPDGPPLRKKIWVLTREAFDLLLLSLDADREVAARKYELIRAKLLKYFECRGCSLPEDLTDDTINRVARRLYEGQRIWTSEPASYFYGIARNVLKEYWASPEREFARLDALPPLAHPQTATLNSTEGKSDTLQIERRLDQLAVCLAQLPAESRALILDYYEGEKSERICRRKQMAERLGIPQNSLRIRVHRIRERLQRPFGK